MSSLYDYVFAFLLSLVQGLSEFLPISSSGHLVLFNSFFKVKDFDLFFVLVLHLGTLMAILSYYKKELLNIVKDFAKKPLKPKGEGKWIYLTALATLPGVLGVFSFKPLLEKSFKEDNNWLIGLNFILTGILLFLTQFKQKNTFNGKAPLLNFIDFKKKKYLLLTSVLIGFSQILAFFPGISRSGFTISTALFLDWPKKQAIFFSFLLAIPAILGGSLWEFFASFPKKSSFNLSLCLSLCLAFFSSWFFGSLALKWLTYSLKKNLFPYFAFYLWPLGILTIYLSL